MIYCISFTAVFFLGIAIDLACSGEYDPFDYYTSFFHNNVQGQKNYGSFYLSEQYVFDDEEPQSEADINSGEWANYLGKGVKPADVKKAMYDTSSRDIAVLPTDKDIIPGKAAGSLKTNTFLSALMSANHHNALQYYLFAKNLESVANVGYDRWNPAPIDTPGLSGSAKEALKRALGEKDDFLKLRYLYQAERLFHYGGEFNQAMAIYDKYIARGQSRSHVKGWALSLKAGEERRLKDSLKAAYLFSKVFALYPERRVQAYKNFNYCSANADNVAKLAKNDNERANIYAIAGFSDPGPDLKRLKQVYRYAPSSAMVGVLLVREINKLEVRYGGPKLEQKLTGNFDFYNYYANDIARGTELTNLHRLQQFCNKLAADRKYPEPGLGYLGSAYLSWMEGGHTAEGFDALSKADHEHLSKKLSDQKQLLKLLLSVQKIEKFKTVDENELLPVLEWLDKKVKYELTAERAKDCGPDWNDYDGSKFAASSRDFYRMILAEAYLHSGDTVKAALCILKSENTTNVETPAKVHPAATDINGNPVVPATEEPLINGLPDFWLHYLRSGQVKQIIGITKTHPSSPYLRFLSASLSNTVAGELYDLLGTTFLREHKYALAVKAYKHIKKGKNGLGYVEDPNEMADPFISQLPDYPKTLLSGKSKPYDRQMFAEKILSLLNKVKTDPKNASSWYFQLATGLYNASHYGNAYYIISYTWSPSDYGRAKRYSYDNDYVKTITAEKYYLKARSLSKNPEFKAQCTFMAAKCRQKQIPAPEDIVYGDTDDQYSKAERRNPYFKELKKNYSKTAFYQQAVSECSYLRDFLASGKK